MELHFLASLTRCELILEATLRSKPPTEVAIEAVRCTGGM
jgi:hypothetical protein